MLPLLLNPLGLNEGWNETECQRLGDNDLWYGLWYRTQGYPTSHHEMSKRSRHAGLPLVTEDPLSINKTCIPSSIARPYSSDPTVLVWFSCRRVRRIEGWSGVGRGHTIGPLTPGRVLSGVNRRETGVVVFVTFPSRHVDGD